jgi:hypothetical protein
MTPEGFGRFFIWRNDAAVVHRLDKVRCDILALVVACPIPTTRCARAHLSCAKHAFFYGPITNSQWCQLANLQWTGGHRREEGGE